MRRIFKSFLVAALFILPTQGFAKAFVIPHILEVSGRITNTDLHITYTGNLRGVPSAGGATVDLYLYQNNGELLRHRDGTVVCGPCTYDLSETKRKESIRLDDFITRRDRKPAGKLGFAVIVVGGKDPDAVNMQGFVVNSITGPLQLSVFGFEPQPIAAAP